VGLKQLEFAQSYLFSGCSNGSAAGDRFLADDLTLHLDNGDSYQPDTVVSATIQEVKVTVQGVRAAGQEVRATDVALANSAGGEPVCETVQLFAAAGAPQATSAGEVDLGEARRFRLPGTVAVQSGASCGRTLSLAYRDSARSSWSECAFTRSGAQYVLVSCTDGSIADSAIDARYLKLGLFGGEGAVASEAVQLSLVEQEPCGDLGPTVLTDPEGAVFSALRGELYLIGSNAADGARDAYVHGLGSGEWRRIKLDAASAIANVVAATFVAQENRLYFVENGNQGLRIGRWDTLGSNVEWLATLPAEWCLNRFWLEQSLDGRLVFVSAPASPAEQSVVALLTSTNGSNLVIDGSTRFEGAIFGPPLADYDGVSIDVATGGTFEEIGQQRVTYGEFCYSD